MDQDTILSFETPSREGPRVSCGPSPVMELVYAHYYLLKRLHHPRGFEVAWAAPVLAADPELCSEFEAFWSDHALDGPGAEMFVLAARYGFVFDSEPARYLAELENLAVRYARDGTHGPIDSTNPDHAAQAAELQRRVEALRAPGEAKRFALLLERLWGHLEPGWEQQGRAAVSAAAAEFEASFQESGSVLDALPAHHFTRFEHLAQAIQEAAEGGRVTVVPLWLAASGGFGFRVDDEQFVGYGLQSEDVFERTSEKVAGLARRVKALADPSRLLALTMVSTFAGMRPTVGDLAEHIGVSQPTISGHLRMLREVGLVEVEKRGNKSYYRLDQDAARQLLQDLEETLLR